LIDLPNGEWWFMHFQDTGPFGRIVHLQPVTWKDSWPLIGVDYDGNGVGEPVPAWKKPGIGASSPATAPATSDEFAAPALGRQWQWHANHEDAWASLAARPGWLRLQVCPRPDLDLGRMPNFLGQKYPARGFAVETLVDFSGGRPGGLAGLAVVGGKGHAALAVRKASAGDECVLIESGAVERIAALSAGPVRLQARVAPDGSFTLAFAAPGRELVALPKLFLASEGGWIGAKVGLFAAGLTGTAGAGQADFDWFRFAPGDR
jgi:beta-xylosidase